MQPISFESSHVFDSLHWRLFSDIEVDHVYVFQEFNHASVKMVVYVLIHATPLSVTANRGTMEHSVKHVGVGFFTFLFFCFIYPDIYIYWWSIWWHDCIYIIEFWLIFSLGCFEFWFGLLALTSILSDECPQLCLTRWPLVDLNGIVDV